MAVVVYLDVEDEITSAAARIRTAREPRIALVLPYGSRLATSRINFRLLSREATLTGHRLDIVAPDASARALAASAGLSVFGSVGEWESAVEAGDRPDAVPTVAATAAVTAGVVGAVAGPGEDEGPVDAGTAGAEERRPVGNPPVVRSRAGGSRVRPAAIAGIGLLLVSLLVAGVAAWLVLPSAEISLTPRLETIGPISLEVRADPAVTGVDAEAAVIPATTISIPVRASGEFPATGVRVEQTAASGGVRWTNCDPTDSYTIPRGTVVRTAGNVRFATEEEVFLPVAGVSGNPPNVSIECKASEVAVTAVGPGTAGNVAAGTITVIPAGYDRTLVFVTNPAATSGGTRTEIPVVAQADIDAALAQLEAELQAQFADSLVDPVGVPAGATVFPDTAVLGEARTDVDPATLVGREVATFGLQMAAEGTVLAADEAPLQEIAESRLAGSVSDGFELVEGSSVVAVGDATVTDGVIAFPVTGYAQQLRPVDAEALLASVLGLPAEDAEAALAPWGEAEIVLWPDWVTAVPTLEQRVTLTVRAPEGDPLPTPAPSPSGASTPEPSGDVPSEQPVPSP
jgi:hypothetical protein